ncbi:lipoprotein insertase outer membrane protein LolB [Aidingimonas halophila]|uniref:Outer-membrane lipoprotein LolB n=1 Tax=Aidingimonas halophila TaxID=574349 RepID=A0A1H2R6S5_9GAMM|nr:lipoprotein insertase outer membrane protein LolB [Aidingimonas halophila]GHC19833.1 outer-membrane lipoprotein LolB [Aidingimonas halophila]SDW14379.1 outer membrane lipoprotein LolB [Aidingimonas halophila]
MTRLFTVFLFTVLMVGCASRPPSHEDGPQPGQWDAQESTLEALERWQLVGKVGLRLPNDSTSANLDWHQGAAYYRMMLTGPFGSGRSVLEGRSDEVTLTTGEGRFEAETPEALMQEQLGWSLPVSSLHYWVRGLPAPDRASQREMDDRGFPAELDQDGWTIEYRDWTLVEDLWLPRRMVMTQDDVRATLVVNEWEPQVDND